MHRLLIFSTVVLVITSSCEVNEFVTDIEKENLNGKVNTVKSISYDAVEKFGEITYTNRNDYENYLTRYSNSGSILEHAKNDQDGWAISTRVHKYDENDLLMKLIWYDKDYKLSSYSLFLNNSDGNIIEQEVYNSDSTLSRKYLYDRDEHGNDIEINGYNAEGELVTKWKRKFDEFNNPVETISYNAEGELFQKVLFEWDINSNLTDERRYDSEGKLIFHKEIGYNEHGDVAWESIIHEYEWSDIVEGIWEYEYRDLDDQLNWTVKIVRLDNELHSYVKREIDYY